MNVYDAQGEGICVLLYFVFVYHDRFVFFFFAQSLRSYFYYGWWIENGKLMVNNDGAL